MAADRRVSGVGRRVAALAERHAVRPQERGSVPLRSTTCAHERGVCDGPQRGEDRGRAQQPRAAAGPDGCREVLRRVTPDIRLQPGNNANGERGRLVAVPECPCVRTVDDGDQRRAGRLAGHEVPLSILAAGRGNPRGRHGWQCAHRARRCMATLDRGALLPELPVGPCDRQQCGAPHGRTAVRRRRGAKPSWCRTPPFRA